MVTELMWDGKFKDGKKVGPVRIELPFQTVETVNETAKERQLTLDRLFSGQETDWRNRLIWGDKKYVLPSLLPEFAGQVNLIYIDPPFFSGTNQQIIVQVPDSEFLSREPSMIEEAAYRNVWREGADSFCQWTYDTLNTLKELLSPSGAIF